VLFNYVLSTTQTHLFKYIGTLIGILFSV